MKNETHKPKSTTGAMPAARSSTSLSASFCSLASARTAAKHCAGLAHAWGLALLRRNRPAHARRALVIEKVGRKFSGTALIREFLPNAFCAGRPEATCKQAMRGVCPLVCLGERSVPVACGMRAE